MKDDLPNSTAEISPEQRVLTISGRVADSALNLVNPRLIQLKKTDRNWFFLASTYPSLKVGDKFSRLYVFSYSGLIIPLSKAPCVLTALQSDCGNYFDVDLPNLPYKKIWGWRPIGLLKFSVGLPHFERFPHDIHEHWKGSYYPFLMASGENYHAALQNEPTPTLENIRDFLDVLTTWTGPDNPHLGNYFDIECADSLEGPFYTIHDSRWKIRREEILVSQWQQMVRECAPNYGILQIQFSRLFYLLRKLWDKPPTHAWKLFVSEGPFYSIFHDDFVIEVGGKFYLLHFSASD